MNHWTPRATQAKNTMSSGYETPNRKTRASEFETMPRFVLSMAGSRCCVWWPKLVIDFQSKGQAKVKQKRLDFSRNECRARRFVSSVHQCYNFHFGPRVYCLHGVTHLRKRPHVSTIFGEKWIHGVTQIPRNTPGIDTQDTR